MTVDRYAQCDDTCTVDCGACKGAGRPSGALAANPRRLAWFTDDELVDELERRATGNGGAEALRGVLLRHHPIAHTMTGPLKGCRCGQVKLGQDVIAHVAAELRAAQAGGPVGSGGPGLVALHPGETYSTSEQVRAALAPQAGDGAR